MKQTEIKERIATAINVQFTDYQSRSIINDTQTRIIALKKEADALAPQFEEYKKAYENLKFQYDAVIEKLKQDEALLEIMSRTVNDLGKGGKKPLRVVRAESHNDMKEKEKVKHRNESDKKEYFRWTDYAAEVLKSEKRMMTEQELWDTIYIMYDIEDKLKESGKLNALSGLRWGAIHTCWGGNIKLVMQKGGKWAETKGKLFKWNNHIGLKEWANENGDWTPKLEFKRGIPAKVANG